MSSEKYQVGKGITLPAGLPRVGGSSGATGPAAMRSAVARLGLLMFLQVSWSTLPGQTAADFKPQGVSRDRVG